jgi:hypothetical protein
VKVEAIINFLRPGKAASRYNEGIKRLKREIVKGDFFLLIC